MNPIIIIDSREQNPFIFPDSVSVEVGTLSTGDYSIKNLEEYIAVERKSIPDLVGCCSNKKPKCNRDRFKRELKRLQAYRYRCVIIEGSLAQVQAGGWRGQIKPAQVIGSICSWQNRYNIAFWFADNPQRASYLCQAVLRTAYQQLSQFSKLIKEKI